MEYITKEEQLSHISCYYSNIYHIKNPCEEAQLYVVEHQPLMFVLISDPCEAAQLVAVKNNLVALGNIKTPCDDVVRWACGCSWRALEHVVNVSEELQLHFIKQSEVPYKYLLNPTPAATKLQYLLWRILYDIG